ncbi:hypothetical protein ACIPX0_08870 [Streptomyces sp. NPDC090075]
MAAAWEGDSLAGVVTAKASAVSCAGFVAAACRVLCTDVVRRTER